jgi:curved DNA-binding protein CbpA
MTTGKQIGLAAAVLGGLYWLFSSSDKSLGGLSGYFETNNIKTLDDLKKQYYKLAKKYHPDTDTGSKEDFQALANEYEKLFKKLLNGSNLSSDEKETEIAIDANLRKIYESIMHLPGIEVELAGQWLWVSGQTYPIREELKKADFKFASKKKMWYYPGVEAGGRGNFSISEIRNKYGSVKLQTARQEQLNGVGSLDKPKLVKSFKAIKTALRKRRSNTNKSQSTPANLIKSMKGKSAFQKLSGLGNSLRSYPIPLNQAAKKIMLKILSVMESKGDATYRKFDNSEGTFMPLSVEIIGETKMGREISLAHYYEQNGDLMADPEMIFLEVEGEFYPAYYKQDGLGLEKYSIKYDREKMIGYNRALQKDQTQFANMWLKNIKQQQGL